MAGLRSRQPMDLYLIRHTEVAKNLRGQHGGGDETVTERGKAQITAFAKQFAQLPQLTIVHQPDVRSRETAVKIAQQMRENREMIVKTREMPEFKGIDMGAVAGLSDKALALRYPLVALSYLLWRSGFSLRRPKIAGAESITDFATRVAAGLEKLLKTKHESVLFVGTTSTILTLNHLLTNDGVFRRRAYHYYALQFGDCAHWRIVPTGLPRLAPGNVNAI